MNKEEIPILLECTNCGHVAGAVVKLECKECPKLESERDNLREAFEKYGQHLIDCEIVGSDCPGKCTCGLWEAQEALTRSTEKGMGEKV